MKVDGATPKRWRIVRGHDKPIHGGCAIYFPGGIDATIGDVKVMFNKEDLISVVVQVNALKKPSQIVSFSNFVMGLYWSLR